MEYNRFHTHTRVRARILSDNHHLVMDLLPQELIDAIIDNVPNFSLLSCSLVAKRWRQKSQRRAFEIILFSSEDEVNRWCTDISRNSDGISSYVRHVKIDEISSWAEPALFGRMLGTLSLLTTLWVDETEIPDELPGHISRGVFGKDITALYLHSPRCTLTTVTSMILSLPDLKELVVEDWTATSEEPLPSYSATPRGRQLHSLELQGDVGGIGEALAKSRSTTNCLSLDVHILGVEQLLMVSSETVVELKLCGV